MNTISKTLCSDPQYYFEKCKSINLQNHKFVEAY